MATTRAIKARTIGDSHRERIMNVSSPPGSPLLESHVLQRARVGEAADQIHAGLVHARADAPDEGQLVDRNLDLPVVKDLRDLVQQRLAALHVGLARLALE